MGMVIVGMDLVSGNALTNSIGEEGFGNGDGLSWDLDIDAYVYRMYI